MNKLLIPLIITLPLLFTACSSKLNYNSSFKKNVNLEEDYKISGNIELYRNVGFLTETVQNRVILYIDNKLIVKAPLNENFSGRIELFYNKKPLTIECGKDNLFSQPKCNVFLNNQNLGNLEFRPDYLG
ncbi:hypothetical protein KO488_12865 [Poseidonibacter lekithochrous]|uniref:hypothetical protein n=1 Tax=Poseidonibacter TaxID=2321187 RepID=UPI001C08A4BA|nr:MULTISPECIES: hypothetical protein [Poseidonibacter]MBU3015654.1 hypothetical protein [Poseidonibacter lekithochrous]MDO6828955.1 hypothetical protein [Poseidonibacter sp. 1_MG-2023]